jgi:hypothetical protein
MTSSGIKTRDLPDCSIVPQPSTLPRSECIKVVNEINVAENMAAYSSHMRVYKIDLGVEYEGKKESSSEWRGT